MPKVTKARRSCRYKPYNAPNTILSRQKSTASNADSLPLNAQDLKDWLSVESNLPNSSTSLTTTSTAGAEECIEEEPEDSVSTINGSVAESEEFVVDLLDDNAQYASPLRRDTRLNRFILTFFPPDRNDKWLDPNTYFTNANQLFDLWVGQFEICPSTNNLHAHIYVECKRDTRPRFSKVNEAFRRYFERVQIKSSRRASTKQRQCAINYCMDPRKRAPDTECSSWAGNKFTPSFDEASAKGEESKKREEAERQRLYIEGKPRMWTWDQIVHENEDSKQLLFTCSWGEKYHKGRMAEVKRRSIQEVIILYGAGGTGKTTMAGAWGANDDEDPRERYYRRNPDDGAFWGGGRTAYKGQRIIHYEEFTGQEAFSRLKEVCDIGKHGPPVNVKNGGAELNHEIVIFTSNVHPAGWFHNLWENDPKQFHPFWRRITKVWFYPSHRGDGTLNIPDEENPPYFIDQTAEFKEFGGDYDQCKKHAEKHWPLRLEAPPEAMRAVLPKPSLQRDPPFFQYCKSGKDPTK
jgi:hypothetical protein